MFLHKYIDLTIEILDEPLYKFDSADNLFQYDRHHLGTEAKEYPTSKHGIKVWQDHDIIANSIVIGSGGSTGVQQNSSLIDNDRLLICCSNTIFCLNVPDLKLKWKTQADQATCFKLFKLEEDYIIHGELQITRLDKDGNIKWQFGGNDIFVSIDEEEFRLTDDRILLVDFGGTAYKIDFDGKLI